VLFEHSFDAFDLRGMVKVRGSVDRVDLIFEETGMLKTVRVLDYKGPIRALSKREKYETEIRLNLNCQLPIYAFVAQAHWFGEYDSPEVNEKTEMGYLFYDADYAEVAKKQKKSLINLGEMEGLEQFWDTLQENLEELKAANFPVDPLISSYNDYQSVCRVEAIDAEDLINS
jgi:ATP-dependent helicase/DNAse subunit B